MTATYDFYLHIIPTYNINRCFIFCMLPPRFGCLVCLSYSSNGNENCFCNNATTTTRPRISALVWCMIVEGNIFLDDKSVNSRRWRMRLWLATGVSFIRRQFCAAIILLSRQMPPFIIIFWVAPAAAPLSSVLSRLHLFFLNHFMSVITMFFPSFGSSLGWSKATVVGWSMTGERRWWRQQVAYILERTLIFLLLSSYFSSPHHIINSNTISLCFAFLLISNSFCVALLTFLLLLLFMFVCPPYLRLEFGGRL